LVRKKAKELLEKAKQKVEKLIEEKKVKKRKNKVSSISCHGNNFTKVEKLKY